FIDGVALPTSATDAHGSPSAGRDGPLDDTALAPGRHHVRVVRAGFPVWSGWVTLTAGRAWELADPTPACSTLDLADVSVQSGAPEPAPGVRCQRWAIARPSLRGGAEIAECSGSRCGPWQPARSAPPVDSGASRAPVAGSEPGAWPRWATWGLVGAGALAATGIVLWQAGAFARGEAGTEFVFTGPSAPAYRF
ncbi:MAG TPA: hypothetical protein VMG12_30070, partial [Polyangiaceae bacterium]|nr:hypothetical protein [Polyangiaceae bacterium]